MFILFRGYGNIVRGGDVYFTAVWTSFGLEPELITLYWGLGRQFFELPLFRLVPFRRGRLS